MAGFSIIENFQPEYNDPFLQKAAELTPELLHKTVLPVSGVPSQPLRRNDDLRLDFGNHYVGFVTLELDYAGSHPDAPAYLYLKFAGRKEELDEKAEDYQGWISRGWLQEEHIHVDVLPATVRLPRRYAFRYLSIQVLDTSAKYALVVKNVSVDAVSAVDAANVLPLNSGDEVLDRIDAISVYTLQECMQTVFEDGPKRDRRLWLGDLRLQALTNYETFRNYDLVKRCLYLFAGLLFNGGKVAACLFTEPQPEPDDTYLLDYSLLFVPTLLEYFEASGDRETLEELYPTAIRQLELAFETLDERDIVTDGGDSFWCFLDWSEGLNKQAGAQAVLIYAIRHGIRLTKLMDDAKTAAHLENMLTLCSQAAMKHRWDEKQQFFVSGADRQISWASQVWMVLAGVLPQEENRLLLCRTEQLDPPIGMMTPYMHHYYLEALLKCGETEKAIAHMKYYWGGMLTLGANTFWEAFDPSDPHASPYGSHMANSYCHAWSCTPAYFLRRMQL